MKGYEKHILSTEQPNTAWCGANTGNEFVFIDVEHACMTVKAGGRLVPCRECLKAVARLLKIEV